MGLFKQIAEPLVARNVPVIPLRPHTKVAFLSNWQELATTSPEKINEWDAECDEYNGACVAFAKPGGTWFFEIDKPGIDKEIEKETGYTFPETLMVRSSPGRGHYYFRQTPASIAMGNAQGKDADGKEAWSARVDNKYVVAPLSFHPTSGRQYEIIRDSDILEAPDWLIEWCVKHNAAGDPTRVNASPDGPPIPRGSHDNELFRIACLLRNAGMDYEQIRDNLITVCEKRCVGYGADYVDMCEKKAKSACRYPVGQATHAYVGSSLAQSNGSAAVTALAPLPSSIVEPPPEIQDKVIPYPVFPRNVMEGTSLFEGFVKPICDANSRIPEFMFMPGIAIVMNYLFGKIEIAHKAPHAGLFLIVIGRKGKTNKSSSIADTVAYMKTAGIVSNASKSLSEGKSFIYTPGSTEGLGTQMLASQCKNVIIWFDELKTLVSKASIQGSSMIGHLCTLCESGEFTNSVKSKKDTFSFPAGTYIASLITSTTDQNFASLWSAMGGDSSGLDDRCMFLYQPEMLPQFISQHQVNTVEGAAVTRQRIEQAISQKKYEIEDERILNENGEALGNRGIRRLESFALYFAVDLGKRTIDNECLERALEIVKYEAAVKDYLHVFEADNKEAVVQNEVIQFLQRNKGKATIRQMNRSVHPMKYGTTMWNKVFRGLVNGGWIVESGTGVKGDPKMVILMRAPEEEDDV